MKDTKDVFYEVYRRVSTTAPTLFAQMDREQICSVILAYGDTYWTERPSAYSDGLSKVAHRQLAKIMRELYGAKYLYEDWINEENC